MAASRKIIDLRNLLTERFSHPSCTTARRLNTGLPFLDEPIPGGLPRGAITELISPARSATHSVAGGTHHLAEQYISDILIALNRATPEQSFLLRAHIGNYSLFISGIFHENTQRRSLRGGPDIQFYEQVGRTNYQLVSSHAVARRCELNDVFEGLADRFREIRLALNQLSDQLLNLDEDARPSLSL